MAVSLCFDRLWHLPFARIPGSDGGTQELLSFVSLEAQPNLPRPFRRRPRRVSKVTIRPSAPSFFNHQANQLMARDRMDGNLGLAKFMVWMADVLIMEDKWAPPRNLTLL